MHFRPRESGLCASAQGITFASSGVHPLYFSALFSCDSQTHYLHIPHDITWRLLRTIQHTMATADSNIVTAIRGYNKTMERPVPVGLDQEMPQPVSHQMLSKHSVERLSQILVQSHAGAP